MKNHGQSPLACQRSRSAGKTRKGFIKTEQEIVNWEAGSEADGIYP